MTPTYGGEVKEGKGSKQNSTQWCSGWGRKGGVEVTGVAGRKNRREHLGGKEAGAERSPYPVRRGGRVSEGKGGMHDS